MNISPFVPDPDPAESSRRWETWLLSLDFYFQAAKTESSQKLPLLLHLGGPAVQGIYTTTIEKELKPADRTFEVVSKAVTAHFKPKLNVEFEIFKFRKCQQLEGETVGQYNTRLRELALNCDFPNVDKEIKSQIISSCRDAGLRRRALRDPTLTLKGLLDLAQVLEASETQAKAIENDLQRLKLEERSYHISNDNECGNCGYRHRYPGVCPAKGKTCNYCGKPNHFANKCRSRKAGRPPSRNDNENSRQSPNDSNKNINKDKTSSRDHRPRQQSTAHDKAPKNDRRDAHHVDQQDESSDNDTNSEMSEMPTFHVHALNGSRRLPRADINIGGQIMSLTLDTGASVNILRESDYSRLSLKPKLHRSGIRLFAYGSQDPLPIIGKFRTLVSHVDDHSKLVTTEFYVVTGSYSTSLLSYTTAIEIGLITVHGSVNNVTSSDHDNDRDRAAVHTTIVNAYPSLFEGIGKLKGSSVNLHVDKTATPVAQPPRRLPFHLRKKVEKELRDLEEADIIERVTGPTPWISPIVVTPKPHKPDQIRLCVDMRVPNKAITRSRICTPTVDDIVHRLNGAIVFSKLDLNKGYHQLELHPSSREITAFATHMGTFRYKRLSFGINSAAEVFQETIRQLICDIDGVLNISDDVLVFGRTQKDHDSALHAVLSRLCEHNLTLNKDKCEFSTKKLEFFGYVFSENGISPDPKKVDSIVSMAPPKNASEVRSLLGMTNFCARFIPDYSTITEPLRRLIKNNAEWKWTIEHENALHALRTVLVNEPVIAYFDPHKQTTVTVDASPYGLGAIVTQRIDLSTTPQVIAYASRSLTDVECRYSQTEREALAVVWACEHFHLYLYGAPFTLVSDHKPLELIFNNPKSRPPARIQRWSLRLQPYDFVVQYKSGKDNPADYLSRHAKPSSHTSPQAQSAEEYVNFVVNSVIPRAMSIDDIKQAAVKDTTYQTVLTAIRDNDWPSQCDNEMTAYNAVRDDLTVTDAGLLLRDHRIVVPCSLRDQVIDLAHEGHLGVVKTKQLLRTKVWFPHIDVLVNQKVKNCLACQAVVNDAAREPLKMTELPNRPWEKIAVDFHGPLPSGHSLLVMIDEYSRFPVVEIVSSTSAKSTILAMTKTFATFGIPAVVKSDNGPPFQSAEFAYFAQEQGFRHHRVTPYWPEANGLVERFMKCLKKILQTAKLENDEWMRALHTFLRNYRNTPHATTGKPPAELLFAFSPFLKLPELVQTSPDTELRDRDREVKQKAKTYADKRRHTKQRSFRVRDQVLVKRARSHMHGKADSAYEHRPLIIIEINGDQIKAKRHDGSHVTRNISHFKHFKSCVRQDTVIDDDDHLHAAAPCQDNRNIRMNPVAEHTRYPRRDRRPPDRYGFSCLTNAIH